MKKRIVSICLALVLVLSLVPSAFAATAFVDVPADAWYAKNVAYVSDHGLMAGVSDTKFDPNGRMTRAMVVTVLHRMAGTPATSGKNPFTDVPAGTWYTNAVIWANDTGVTSGTTPTTFAPNANVTREQLVAFLYRYVKNHVTSWMTTADYLEYSDVNNISDYAEEAFAWAVGNGIISGVGNNRLDPKGLATRAQCAAILERTDKYIAEDDAEQEAGVTQPTEPSEPADPTEPSEKPKPTTAEEDAADPTLKYRYPMAEENAQKIVQELIEYGESIGLTHTETDFLYDIENQTGNVSYEYSDMVAADGNNESSYKFCHASIDLAKRCIEEEGAGDYRFYVTYKQHHLDPDMYCLIVYFPHHPPIGTKPEVPAPNADGSLNLEAIMEYGNQYAEYMGAKTDLSLNADNAGYWPGDCFILTDDYTMEMAAEEIAYQVEYTLRQQHLRYGTPYLYITLNSHVWVEDDGYIYFRVYWG